MIALPETGPFVLLDDARPGGARARLYVDPVEIVSTRRAEDVEAGLEALRTATAGGLHAAGYLAFEACRPLEPHLAPLDRQPGAHPLLWFGLFRRCESIAAEGVAALLPDPAGAWIAAPVPAVSEHDHAAAFARVHDYIEAGDIYQANLTFGATARWAGDPLALYAGLRARAAAGYGGIVRTASGWTLSLSPELFFAIDDGAIHTRPMKGTAPRASDPAALRDDAKQRAENLMIVDLLRNDLSRVCVPGSVMTPELFRIETYPTLHQMTSLVRGMLSPGVDAVAALRALFPCGSVTGAPKLRAIEVIDEVEQGPRGLYTGSIGRIDAGGRSAAFNVAIRTLTLGEGTAALGLGSGVVADSRAADEWSECLAKGAFVASTRAFDLIETMAFDPVEGLPLIEAHLARMKASAAALGFTFDRHAARNELQAAVFRLKAPSRVRLVLARSGAMAIACTPLPAFPDAPVEVGVARLATTTADFRRVHKTSDRAFYDAPRRASGHFEIVFVDPEGFVTEGSFTNVFVRREGMLVTPPRARSLLPGVLRQSLLERGEAIEGDLRVDDLAAGFLIGNALRGLLPARLAPL